MLVLIQIISVITYSLSIANVAQSKKNKYLLQDFTSRGSLILLWFRWIVNTNYFDSIRMTLLPLIIIIFFKNNFTTTLRHARNNYFERKFTGCSNNSRDTCKTLNSLIRYKNMSKDIILNHNCSTVSDPSAIAKVFNNYFSNVASNLDRNIPDSNIPPLNFLGAPVENSFFCAPSDRE